MVLTLFPPQRTHEPFSRVCSFVFVSYLSYKQIWTSGVSREEIRNINNLLWPARSALPKLNNKRYDLSPTDMKCGSSSIKKFHLEGNQFTRWLNRLRERKVKHLKCSPARCVLTRARTENSRKQRISNLRSDAVLKIASTQWSFSTMSHPHSKPLYKINVVLSSV